MSEKTKEKDKPEFLKEPEQKTKLSLDKHKPIFQGTNKRIEMTKYILQIAREKLPMSQKKFVNWVAFHTGLSIRTTQEYVELMLDMGVLQNHGSDFELGTEEKGL